MWYDWGLFLSAEPHTDPGEEACGRPVMEAHRKQTGKDRKSPATQQQGSHSPATTAAQSKHWNIWFQVKKTGLDRGLRSLNCAWALQTYGSFVFFFICFFRFKLK